MAAGQGISNWDVRRPPPPKQEEEEKKVKENGGIEKKKEQKCNLFPIFWPFCNITAHFFVTLETLLELQGIAISSTTHSNLKPGFRLPSPPPQKNGRFVQGISIYR